MNNKIEVFKNEQFGEIRTALIENEPWFVAVDVCRALEIGNSSQAISRLDADEKMITLISNEGNKRGNPNMTVVNEPGLYTLILSSRKPEAKAFKRWITHDVIPMIRKTGGYMTDSLLERIQKEPCLLYTSQRKGSLPLTKRTPPEKPPDSRPSPPSLKRTRRSCAGRYGRHFPKLAALTSFLPFCCGRV